MAAHRLEFYGKARLPIERGGPIKGYRWVPGYLLVNRSEISLIGRCVTYREAQKEARLEGKKAVFYPTVEEGIRAWEEHHGSKKDKHNDGDTFQKNGVWYMRHLKYDWPLCAGDVKNIKSLREAVAEGKLRVLLRTDTVWNGEKWITGPSYARIGEPTLGKLSFFTTFVTQCVHEASPWIDIKNPACIKRSLR